jgi:hypothetical protein
MSNDDDYGHVKESAAPMDWPGPIVIKIQQHPPLWLTPEQSSELQWETFE